MVEGSSGRVANATEFISCTGTNLIRKISRKLDFDNNRQNQTVSKLHLANYSSMIRFQSKCVFTLTLYVNIHVRARSRQEGNRFLLFRRKGIIIRYIARLRNTAAREIRVLNALTVYRRFRVFNEYSAAERYDFHRKKKKKNNSSGNYSRYCASLNRWRHPSRSRYTRNTCSISSRAARPLSIDET